MKLTAVLLIAFFSNNNVFALTYYQNNNDYVVRCTGDDGSTWSVEQKAMVNSAHGLKLCKDSKPSIRFVRGSPTQSTGEIRHTSETLRPLRK